MRRTEATIDSMTKQERNNYKLIDASRKTRIAKGSGSTIAEVNALLKQYTEMRNMMTQMNRAGIFGGLGGAAMNGLGGGMMKKMGGLLGGGMPNLDGMSGGLGSMFGGANNSDHEETSQQTRIRKKKRHKKKR
jgi:signal recognition particle subunit SRP54